MRETLGEIVTYVVLGLLAVVTIVAVLAAYLAAAVATVAPYACFAAVIWLLARGRMMADLTRRGYHDRDETTICRGALPLVIEEPGGGVTIEVGNCADRFALRLSADELLAICRLVKVTPSSS